MKSALDVFWESQDWTTLKRVNDWDVEREGERILLTLPARDGERYKLLCLCNEYPKLAPSVAFINNEGSKSDRRAWPTGNSNFHQIVKLPADSFLCFELSREGLNHHNDWRAQANAWNGTKHTIMNIFNVVHRLLQSHDYMGRAS